MKRSGHNQFSVILPAAGRGTRMESEVPKALTPFEGTTFLEMQIDKFSRFTENIYVIVSQDQLNIFEELKARKKLQIHLLVQMPGKGTYFAIKTALPLIDSMYVITCWADQIGVTSSLIASVCNNLRTQQSGLVIPLIAQENPYVRANLSDTGDLLGWSYQREGAVTSAGFSDLGIFGFRTAALKDESLNITDISSFSSPKTEEFNFLDCLPFLAKTFGFTKITWSDSVCAISVNSISELRVAEKVLAGKSLNSFLISIILPSFNEEKWLVPLLNDLKDLQTYKDDVFEIRYEIIFVDDGSTDNTINVLNAYDFKYIYQSNQGKGSAVKNGVQKAKGDYILVLDADGEYLVSDIQNFAKEIAMNPLVTVYGSRYLSIDKKGIRLLPLENQSILNLYFNYILSLIIYLRYRVQISDPLTGLKLYSREIYNWINPKTVGFETDHEISLELIRCKIPIIEIPVKYLPRTKAQGKKISYKDAFKALLLWLT